MNTLEHFFLAALASALFLSGCAHRTPMTQADVIRISDRAATKAGFRLVEFERPEVHAPKNGKWTVMYEGKIPPPGPDGLVELKLGHHFLVWVDERTGAPQLMLGE